VTAGPVPLFHSHARPDSPSPVSTDPRHITARKLVRIIDVYFADGPSVVRTNEGVVQAQPGDAIITGIAGEHWRVTRSRFAAKYRPVPPTIAGQSGRYVSLPNQITGVRMSEPFEVLLADGVSRLTGRAGDWLVDYGDGSLGIVSPAIFATTYEII